MLAVLAILSNTAFAQSTTLSGRVTDENSRPLPFANVYLGGTTRGTTADKNGDYALTVPLGTVAVVSSFLVKAIATEPLVIDNHALGYRLFYDLQQFDGSFVAVCFGGTSRFEEIPADTEQQAERYRRNRARVYRRRPGFGDCYYRTKTNNNRSCPA